MPIDIIRPRVYIADMSNRDQTIEDQLRQAIQAQAGSVLGLAKRVKVSQPILHRFLNRERGITLATAAQIAKVLGLELVPKVKGGKK